MREELSIVISNRSAAHLDTQDYLSALVDAELVIQIRKNWPKGHFRKAKALRAMGKLDDAVDALRLGLAFEPTNTVRAGCQYFLIREPTLSPRRNYLGC